jgi:hypothetical protein
MSIIKMKLGPVDVICCASFVMLFGSSFLVPCHAQTSNPTNTVCPENCKPDKCQYNKEMERQECSECEVPYTLKEDDKSCVRVGIWPRDPILEVGQNLTLECILSPKDAASFTAHDLYFKLGNETIDDRYVRVVDNYTAELNKPMTNKLHMHVFCYARGKYERIGQQNVMVGRKPIRPTITGCKVHNWEKMTCTWTPNKTEQESHTGLVTKMELHWTILGIWTHCPYNYTNSCEWLNNPNEKGDVLRLT